MERRQPPDLGTGASTWPCAQSRTQACLEPVSVPGLVLGEQRVNVLAPWWTFLPLPLETTVERTGLSLAGLFLTVPGWCVGNCLRLKRQEIVSMKVTGLRTGTVAPIPILQMLALRSLGSVRMLLGSRDGPFPTSERLCG